MKAVFFDFAVYSHDRHGIYSLSSTLKKNGWAVSFISEGKLKNAIQKIVKEKPDLLLYSSFSSSMPFFIEFDRLIKSKIKITTVIGGPGPTFEYSAFNESTIDAICLGEGETALVEYIKNGFHPVKNIIRPGAIFGDFFPFIDPNDMPLPDREILYASDSVLRDMPSKQFLSGRGCPYQCTYCFNHRYNQMFKNCGPIVRKKEVSYLMEEILNVRGKYPLKHVAFNDDLFIINKKWFLEFSEVFPRKINLPYSCHVRANLIDEDIVKALKQSNCRGVYWSIESGDDNIRNQVLKRGITTEQILGTARLFAKYKIPHRTGNIIGLPGESAEKMLDTLRLNIKSKPFLASAGIFVPFAGLSLTNYAADLGYFDRLIHSDLPADFLSTSMMNISDEENTKTQKLANLFPVFVQFPFLFHSAVLRKILFTLPIFSLKIVHKIFYGFKLMRFYCAKIPLRLQIRLIWRHLISRSNIY